MRRFTIPLALCVCLIALISREHAASFDDIELTTYDTNVQGDISCGVRK